MLVRDKTMQTRLRGRHDLLERGFRRFLPQSVGPPHDNNQTNTNTNTNTNNSTNNDTNANHTVLTIHIMSILQLVLVLIIAPPEPHALGDAGDGGVEVPRAFARVRRPPPAYGDFTTILPNTISEQPLSC